MTRFCGFNGFSGRKMGVSDTEAAPNFMGPPNTTFTGRGSVPEGPLKRYPGKAADISTGNRRLGKTHEGAGGEDGVVFKTHTGFGGERTGRAKKSPGMDGSRKKGMSDNRK